MVATTRPDPHEQRSPASRAAEAEPEEEPKAADSAPAPLEEQPSPEELRVWRAQREWDRRPRPGGPIAKAVAEMLVQAVEAHGFPEVDAAYLELKRSRGYSY